MAKVLSRKHLRLVSVRRAAPNAGLTADTASLVFAVPTLTAKKLWKNGAHGLFPTVQIIWFGDIKWLRKGKLEMNKEAFVRFVSIVAVLVGSILIYGNVFSYIDNLVVPYHPEIGAGLGVIVLAGGITGLWIKRR
ncbi:hypothetical protein ACFPT7_01620 [Acidicapsa dinghuensis]|uniref:Uncharacterized protein n=1 Tax=Acidicapsa dinghuensis TaxID=2218256 RepID=A0ABW1E9S2_9BACT|nr:hypothetical protein [Acidicapsa dinghuensis]